MSALEHAEPHPPPLQEVHEAMGGELGGVAHEAQAGGGVPPAPARPLAAANDEDEPFDQLGRVLEGYADPETGQTNKPPNAEEE